MDGYTQLKRVLRGKRSKADGAFFERMIEEACFRYLLSGDAYIEKTPEPLQPLKKLPSGCFSAIYKSKAQPDFKGTLRGGRAICFEAKATNSDRIDCNRLQPKQIEALSIHKKLGALVFILAMFLTENRCFRLPLEYWLNAKAMYGRKYFKIEDLKDYEIEVEGMKMDFLADFIKNEGAVNGKKQTCAKF